ncbi:MAG: aspartate-semialdehyde dehydrogenase, partial [candidate division WOR-3 bacterium]
MRICILGASGLVGKTLLKVLEEKKFPFKEIILFGGEEKEIKINGKEFKIEKFEGKLPECDLFFSCLDTDEAIQIVPQILKMRKR